MFLLHQKKVCKSTKSRAHPPVQLRRIRHTKNMTLRETLISLHHMVLSVVHYCAHHAPQQRIDILWHPYSMPLQMQRHVPPPKRRDTHREPLKVPLNLPKAHHWDYWVCCSWDSTAMSWRWQVHRAHCSLVCTSEVKKKNIC
jgi:hypothetical protein